MVVSLADQMNTATLCVTTVSVYAACDRTRGVEMLVSSSEVQAAKRTNGVSASQPADAKASRSRGVAVVVVEGKQPSPVQRRCFLLERVRLSARRM